MRVLHPAFMQLEPVSGDGKVAIGSIVSSEEEKRKFAAATMDFNRRQKKFCDLFPQLLTLAEEPAAAAGAGVR